MKLFKYQDCIYHSRSEAALSILLQQYTPYMPREGETLHVRSVDFLLENLFIEWHPRWKYSGSPSLKQQNIRRAIKTSQYPERELIYLESLRDFYSHLLPRFCSPLPSWDAVAQSWNCALRLPKQVFTSAMSDGGRI